jgi:hypothetical protein
MTKSIHRKRLEVLAAIAGIVAALVAIIALILQFSQVPVFDGSSISTVPSGSSTPSGADESPSPSRTPSENGPATTPSSEPSAAEVYLDQLDPIEDELEPMSISWGSATFSRSLTNPLSGCSAVGPVDWVVPPRVNTLETEIGVAIDAVEPESKVTFNVYIDGSRVFTRTLAVGQHEPATIPLGAGLRIRFETIIDESRRSNCNTEARAVWGDPRLVP